jgi:putative hydrolase of the HAD superfamily
VSRLFFPEAIGASPLSSPTVASRFARVETFVFDLDNTLYPADSALWPQIDARITLYLTKFFGMDGLSARALHKFYYHRYGTTLKGLIDEHEIDATEFLSFVHDIDRSSLSPNIALAREIASLPGRKLVMTNGSREHAIRTLEKLGVDGLFEGFFDIVAAHLVPKPAAAAYETFFEAYGVDPFRAAMFEDIAINLAVPHRRGMATTLVVPKAGQADFRERTDREGEDAPTIDFVTNDLPGFLAQINAARGESA